MRAEAEKRHMAGGYVVLMFAVFAGCILLVLLFGASSYEKLIERDNQSFEQRTGVSYIAAKLRHNDVAGGAWVASFSDKSDRNADDTDTLYLTFIGDDGVLVPEYYTKIYYYDGFIREILCEDGLTLTPEAGNEIMAASGLSFEQNGNCISVAVTDEEGIQTKLSLTLRSN